MCMTLSNMLATLVDIGLTECPTIEVENSNWWLSSHLYEVVSGHHRGTMSHFNGDHLGNRDGGSGAWWSFSLQLRGASKESSLNPKPWLGPVGPVHHQHRYWHYFRWNPSITITILSHDENWMETKAGFCAWLWRLSSAEGKMEIQVQSMKDGISVALSLKH